MEYEEEMEKKSKCFKKIVKRANDLLEDSYKYHLMSEYCAETLEDKERFDNISDTLYNLFMGEHKAIGETFKKED